MAIGLDGVIAAETILSKTDQTNGMVWVRGVDLPTLATQHGFEGTVALLWDGFAGDGLTRDGIHTALGTARLRAFDALGSWLAHAAGRSLFEGVRIALASQPDTATATDLLAALTVAVPALVRQQAGGRPIAPAPNLGTAADLLHMLHDAVPGSAEAGALDTYFTVMAESGLNASAFTARIVASTRASLTDAVLAAWCAFTGALHGGAPGPTLDLLDLAAAQPDLDAWLEAKLRAGERLMGFGHRVFQGNDPRAAAMRRSLAAMGPAAGHLAFAETLEKAVAAAMERVKPGRKLPPNVEITAALLLDAVGIPRDAFTLAFRRRSQPRLDRPCAGAAADRAADAPGLGLYRAADRVDLSLDRGIRAGVSSGSTLSEVIMIFRQLFDATSGTYTYLLASRIGRRSADHRSGAGEGGPLPRFDPGT